MTIPAIPLTPSRTIGTGYPAYIIAEIGSNHDGDLERAKTLIRKAKDAGADAAKFQSFQVKTLINHRWKSEGRWVNDPSWNLLESLSLPQEWHDLLQQEAREQDIDFISTPFDNERLKWLVDLDVPAIKIASGDLTYFELLKAAGESGKPIFLSTGHANLGEVENGLQVLWKTGCKHIVLLHCASIYPASFKDTRLRSMTSMQQGFQVQVGYSDHTPGSVATLGAIALGACVIEKHLTDDRTRSGPDHPFALTTDEFGQMVKEVRQLEEALTGKIKSPRPPEKEERILARRAIYANTNIARGMTVQREMVKIVRHAYPEGVPADAWEKIEGKPVVSDIEEHALITWDMF
ncbi:MAG: N-acetylneuraminate synthase family protein [Waddliaceae bacterium]